MDVAPERVQRPGALPETCGQLCPLVGGYHPWHQVERESLRAGLPAGPGADVLGAPLLLDAVRTGPQFGYTESGDRLQQVLVTRAWPAVRVDGFVVAGEKVAGGPVDVTGGLIPQQQPRTYRQAVPDGSAR